MTHVLRIVVTIFIFFYFKEMRRAWNEFQGKAKQGKEAGYSVVLACLCGDTHRGLHGVTQVGKLVCFPFSQAHLVFMPTVSPDTFSVQHSHGCGHRAQQCVSSPSKDR